MKIDRVSATIRYSKDTGKGAWKVLELGAEGTVAANEDWHQAQADLDGQLGDQLKAMWPTGNGNNGHLSDVQPPPQANPPEHWCEEHGEEFKRQENDRGVWYSHRNGKSWCKEEVSD